MRRGKGAALCLAVCLLVGMLSGCSLQNVRVQTQLVPPGLSGEQAKIQSAFEAYLDESEHSSAETYRLQYPYAGDYRSAFILQDVDGDGHSEAIVFYVPTPESTDIHLNFLCKDDDGWRSVADIAGGSSTVQEIRFGDLFGDGRKELLVGWSLGSTRESRLRVYRAEENALTECYNALYSKMILSPITDEERDDLLLLHLQADHSASAELLTAKNGALTSRAVTAVDGSVVRYGDSAVTKTETGKTLVFADGIKESGRITELLTWDGETLAAPLFDVLQGGSAASFRAGDLAMRDVDGDGAPEWPVFTETASAEIRLTDWMTWDPETESARLVGQGYYCIPEEYLWLWPAEWPTDCLVHYRADRGLRVTSAEETWLFTLTAKDGEWDLLVGEECPVSKRELLAGLIRLNGEVAK